MPSKGTAQKTRSVNSKVVLPDALPSPFGLIVPKDLLQLLLDIFHSAFASNISSDLPLLIQSVKGYLFNRDFESAFGDRHLLAAYAIRWSPSRALAYSNIFCKLPILSSTNSSQHQVTIESSSQHDRSDQAAYNPSEMEAGLRETAGSAEDKIARVVCIGAGAGAEITALGAYMTYVKQAIANVQNESHPGRSLKGKTAWTRLEVTAIDNADWNAVLSRLQTAMLSMPSISPYASAEIKASTRPLVDSADFEVTFVKQDILTMKPDDLEANFTDSMLVTLMFTLSELYNSSMKATTDFLLSMTRVMLPGALLLVVDSPGSYSTIRVGGVKDPYDKEKAAKKYPMKWLLDHTLLESASVARNKNIPEGKPLWENLESHDSLWFRLPSQLRYPVELEDMRYQLHLYKRLDTLEPS